jgi:ABC-type sugar transport system ATPase subunit
VSSVEIRGVSKAFRTRDLALARAVDNVTFRAEAGQFLALLGPSGCGKTTLLRIVAGLETPDAGDVLIGERRVNDVPAAKRRIAMVFQNYALYPHLSVAENIVFGLKVRKVSAAERAQRLQEAARMLGLADYLGRKPSELSGGQRQRVALGRAVVSQAQIVLMDEPLSNLDAKLRQQMREELRGLQQQLGLTVIYVTHDQVEAMTMSDRVVVMRRGEVEQCASPIDLYQRPATVTVAGFIGSPPMNLLPATWQASAAEVVTASGALGFPVALAQPPAGAHDVLVGIRAEHLRLSGDGVAIAGVARVVEYLGADTIVGLDIGMPDRLMARLPGVVRFSIGQPVRLRVDPADLSVFDAASGRRLERSDAPAITLAHAAGA